MQAVDDVHTYVHACMFKKKKRKKTALRAVSKQAIGQNCSLALKWCKHHPVLAICSPSELLCCLTLAPHKEFTWKPNSKLEQKMPHAHLCGSFLLLAESLARTGMKALFYHLRTCFHFFMLHFFLGPLNISSEALSHLSAAQSTPFCNAVGPNDPWK